MLVLIPLTIPHVVEDLQYHEFDRFGISPLGALIAAAVADALGGCGIFYAARRAPIGFVLIAFTGFLWGLGALYVHGPELLAHGPYRHGVISKLLEIAIVITGMLSGFLALASIAAQRRKGAGRHS